MIISGKLTHWSLHTEVHCFDVVAVEEPEVCELGGPEAASIVASFA